MATTVAVKDETLLMLKEMKEIAFFPLAEPWKYSIQILESSKTINFFPLKCA